MGLLLVTGFRPVAGFFVCADGGFFVSAGGVVFFGKDPLHKTHGSQIPLNLHRKLLTLRAERIVLPWGCGAVMLSPPKERLFF